MSALFFDACWIVGGVLTALVLYHGFHLHWWTLKKQPPAVRVSPEVLRELHDEVIFNAVKRGHVVRASFQKGNRS